MPGLLTDRAEAIRRIAERHGPLVRVPVPGKPFYLASCPRMARHVLLTNNKNYRKSFDWKIVHSLLGDGLVTSHDDVWRHTRAAISPAFRPQATARLAPALARVVREEVASWGERHGERLPTVAASTRLALRAFTDAVLDLDTAAEDLATIASSVSTGLRHLDGRLAALVDVDAWLPTPGGWRFRRAVERLDAVLYRWIDGRRARGLGEDLLSVLCAAADDLPHDLPPRRWLRDQLVTFLLAGHETVAVSLTWCLHLLATHPDAQARAREELLAAGEGGAGRPGALPYTEAVIHEALRLFPPVWSLGREAVDDDVLVSGQGGAFQVPAGATVMVSPYAIHRSADLWPEPDAFRPERFLGGPPRDDGTGLRYLPFSAGPRYCVGERVALTELSLALSEVLTRYEVAPARPGPVACEALISLRPKRELTLRLTPLRPGS